MSNLPRLPILPRCATLDHPAHALDAQAANASLAGGVLGL